MLGLDLAVTEEHAGDELRIDAVIAAPGLGVVVEELARGLPDGRLPANPIAAVITYDQVRRFDLVGIIAIR